MKSCSLKLTAFSLLCITEIVYSATINCNGQINALLIYSSGDVNIHTTYRNDYTVVCNLKTEKDGVSISTCAVWASLLAKAKHEGRTISAYYSHPAVTDCATIPHYGNAPAPIYLAL